MVKNKWERSNKGFSLVELVIIIAIIAILAAAIGIAVLRYIEKGRQAKDLYHASMIKDAIQAYAFPDGFQGRNVEYEDPVTHVKENYKRGWIYVDKEEIRCSDQSTALALIESGLVSVSDDTYQKLRENEEESTRWFPDGPDGDYVCKTDINEYVFQNSLVVMARNTWNTYQLDVYIDDGGEISLGASASNTQRSGGHSKDEKAASTFAKKLGFSNAKITPIGEQHSGR